MRLASLALLLLLTLPACAEKSPREILLEQQPPLMTDAGLMRYFADISEAIDDCDSRNRPSSPFGTSVYGGSWGYGVGLSRDFGQSCDSGPLRQRRTEVRLELMRRGLTP